MCKCRSGGEQDLGFKTLSVQNFQLHVDHMEDLVLMSEPIKIMAEALAMMCQYGEIDAKDVDIVLAPLSSTALPAAGTTDSSVHG